MRGPRQIPETTSTRILLQIFVFVLANLQWCLALDYEVEGTTTHQIFMGGARFFPLGTAHNPTNTFSVAVSGCKYKISVESSLSNTYQSGFDQVLYHLISIRTPTNPIYNGMVESHEIPPDDGTTINYLWLAYASGCYFSEQSTNRLIPIWMLDDPNLRDMDFTVPALWQLQVPSSLPSRVVYLNDGTHHTVSDNRMPSTFRYAAPFDQGFTNAEYEVLASTNVDGLVIPTQFTFTRYYVEGKRLLMRTFTQGNATLIRKGTTVSDFRPQFTGRSVTFDKRFRNAKDPVPSVRYWVTNGNWPEINSLSNPYVTSLKKYKGAKAASVTLSKRGNAKHTLLVWLFALLAVLPPVWIYLVNKQKQKKGIKNENNSNRV